MAPHATQQRFAPRLPRESYVDDRPPGLQVSQLLADLKELTALACSNTGLRMVQAGRASSLGKLVQVVLNVPGDVPGAFGQLLQLFW